MGKISLEGLAFYAYHGFYKEEQEKGNHFEVDVHIDADFEEAATDDDLSKTVDYEVIYAIVKKEMAKTSKLLEHVVRNIAQQILKEEKVNEVEVGLAKYNPPIKGECKRARVSLKLSR